MLEVRTATRADRSDVVRVMAQAFADDPVMRWVVPPGRDLRRLFWAHARFSHYSPGTTDLALLDGRAVGAAFWDPPGFRVPTARQVASLPAYVWALGRHLPRGATVENLMHQARPPGPFWYLAGIGAIRRGEGIGTALLRHRLEQVDRADAPSYLESSKWDNVPLYERFGFELRDPLRVPDGPELWPMWRNVRR